MAEGLKLGLVFVVFILLFRLLYRGWQKIALLKSGENFKFLLFCSPFRKDLTWRDVKYSLMVLLDSFICLAILIWIERRIF